MPLLINQSVVTDDKWVRVDADTLAQHPDAAIIVPFELFAAEQDSLLAGDRPLAVQINGDQDFELVLANLERLSLVVIEFPVFTDGRGFSFARILRRKGFSGEIRATGDVSHDRLEYMTRCGFDAFEIQDERFTGETCSVFGEITVHYQGSADDERPIFRR